MIPAPWKIYAKNKVNEILNEVSDCLTLKTPIPIESVAELYIGDVNIITRMDINFPTGVSALAKKDMENGWLIVVDGKECIQRQRFSLAHELAHIVLPMNQAKEMHCSTDSKGWDEELCDQFAGDILMPENMVRTMCQSNPRPFIGDVMKTFKVSQAVAEIQLKRLGLPF